MIYVMCVLLLFSICLLIKNPKNKYTYFFVFMTIGLVGMIYTSITFWKYAYPDSWFFRLDYKLLLKFSMNRWKHYNMLDSFNICIVVYMLSMQFFDYDTDRVHSDKRRFIKGILFLIFGMVYLWFFDSDTAFKIYMRLHTGVSSATFRFGVIMLNGLLVTVQTIYILLPGIKMLALQHREEFWPKKRQMLTFGCYISAAGIFAVCYFVFGPLRNNYLDLSANNLLGLREYFRVSTYQYFILVCLLCIFVLASLYIIFHGKMLLTSAAIRRKLFKSRWKLDAETREIFHMMKNILFNIEATAQQALMTESKEEKDKRLKQISQLCETRINEFFGITAASNEDCYEMRPVEVFEIIEEAIKRVTFGKDIKVEYEYTLDDGLIYADSLSLTESIANILKNAEESFKNSEKTHKVITIKVRSNENMIGIEIIDNGNGIKKKELKSIFKPLYTTKNRSNNWGVGLAYVYKTILAHCGHIKISSVENEGTCVSIILYRQEGHYLWKKK